MRQIIIYRSRTGFTERYAKWVAEALKCTCVPVEQVETIRLADYDVIIFGSSFRAGTIESIKWYKENVLPAGKLNVVFVTGATPPASPEVIKSMEQNFSRQERKEIRTFYLQSGLNYEAMNFGDKLMMKMFRSMLKSKKIKNEEARAFAELVQKSFDRCDPANLDPMLNYLQGL